MSERKYACWSTCTKRVSLCYVCTVSLISLKALKISACECRIVSPLQYDLKLKKAGYGELIKYAFFCCLYIFPAKYMNVLNLP